MEDSKKVQWQNNKRDLLIYGITFKTLSSGRESNFWQGEKRSFQAEIGISHLQGGRKPSLRGKLFSFLVLIYGSPFFLLCSFRLSFSFLSIHCWYLHLHLRCLLWDSDFRASSSIEHLKLCISKVPQSDCDQNESLYFLFQSFTMSYNLWHLSASSSCLISNQSSSVHLYIFSYIYFPPPCPIVSSYLLLPLYFRFFFYIPFYSLRMIFMNSKSIMSHPCINL